VTRALASLALVGLFATTDAPIKTLPLPMLPSVAHVRIDVTRAHVVSTTDVDLPKGDWRGGDLDLCIAFGAPGAPLAFDARLFAVPDGALEPRESDGGQLLTSERSARCPESARELLGPANMAGVVVHVPEAAFWRSVAPGRMAVLRLRSLLVLPAEDARSGREVVARLGSARGTPLTLGTVQVDSSDESVHLSGASAHLCGPDADPWPLAVALVPRASPAPAPSSPPPIAPVLAVRHASDDLCVRFWTGG
jgi:hypothetical protein